MKYKKSAARNEIVECCKKYNVRYRASEFGVSILDPQPKFISIDYIFLNKEECIKYVIDCAEPSVQSTLDSFK